MTIFPRIHYKWARFEIYRSSLKGLSTELECLIFKSNALCSFWNKADYESIKQGNPLMILNVTIYRIHQNKSFKFFFISPCTDKGHCLSKVHILRVVNELEEYRIHNGML